ncbi:hypothetical protein ACFLUU_00735 [Chloroflexota bacterium]
MTQASVQGQEISYELNTLGWKAFQDLCLTIARDVFGQSVQTFSPVKDGGRDGAFHGTWKENTNINISGASVIQCKYTSSKDKTITKSSLEDELKKARTLARKGLAHNYILMTNHKVLGPTEEKISKAFLNIPQIKEFRLFGSEWITQKIKESSRLRMLVPRVYGLGDLSQILDERAYAQAKEILDAMREDLRKVVITDAYKKSAEAIIKHGFVLLLGEPASGKSTIASALSLGALDRWKCSTIVIRDADEFQRHWNPEEKQFFWVDDIFGTTQYQRHKADEWNRIFPHINSAIRRGTKVLFTSRDYIYRAAKSDVKTSVFPLLDESQVIINVQQLSLSEKKQILYNHIKLGDQEISYKRRIKYFLNDVAVSRHFLPEIARRLGNRAFTRDLIPNRYSVIDFSEKPMLFLVEVVKSLSAQSRAALTLLFIHGGSIKSPINLDSKDGKALQLLGASIADVREALNQMESSLVKYLQKEDDPQWVFRHPTISDAIATIVAEDPELVDIYLSGTSTEKIMNEVTCGSVGYEGVKVIIPASHYYGFIKRLDNITNEYMVMHFLSSRCDRAFLKLFIEHHPNFYEEYFSHFPQVSANPGAAVIAKLYEYNILPEELRLKFIEAIRETAVSIPDADFLANSEMREVFHESEITRIIDVVHKELFSDVESVETLVEEEESLWDRSYNSPEQHFEQLKSTLETYRKEFIYRGMPVEVIEDGISGIDRSIDRLNEEYEEREYDEEDYESYLESISDSEERSIFDDLDE